jgi:hypothetical protein
MDLTTATPVQIDTALAEIYGRYYDKCDQADLQRGYRKDLQDTLDQVDKGTYRFHFNEQYDRPRYEKMVAERTAKIEALTDEANAIYAEMTPFNLEFKRRGGWTRFYVVMGGHIHSSMACSTCNKMGKATRFGWLPERSGQSEAEALESLVTESHKTVLCSVCFPTAPVAWTVVRQDDSVCKGSGTWDYKEGGKQRLGFYTGNYATCAHCDTPQTVLRGGKFRKHKKA